MATEFNRMFCEKIKKLKSELAGPVTIDPAERLRTWLSKRSEAITELEFKEVNEDEIHQKAQRKENFWIRYDRFFPSKGCSTPSQESSHPCNQFKHCETFLRTLENPTH